MKNWHVELSIDEYFVGLRLVPWEILIAPYGSIGVTYVDGALESQTGDDDDDDLAYYARLGAAFTVGFLRFGVDGRALLGSEVDIGSIDSDLDNYQLAAFVGVGF